LHIVKSIEKGIILCYTETGDNDMYFQDLIFALQQFWAAKGCIVQQPYDMEVGAGTFPPATFLRSLGPEPWNTAYVQP